MQETLGERLIYQSMVAESIGEYEDSYKYLEDLIKSKKEDISSSAVILLENVAKIIVKSKQKSYSAAISSKKLENSLGNVKLDHLLHELITSLYKETLTSIDKTIKLIDNYLLKKSSLSDIHKNYYLKIKGDLLVIQEELTNDFLKADLSGANLEVKEKESNIMKTAEAIFDQIFSEFFVKKKLYTRGDSMSVNITYSYAYFQVFHGIKLENRSQALTVLDNCINDCESVIQTTLNQQEYYSFKENIDKLKYLKSKANF